MKIPKFVDVLGVRYKVQVRKGVTDQAGNPAMGICDIHAKVISLDKDHNKFKKDLVSTFIHEVGHAIFWESSLCQTSISYDLEEIIVDLYGKVLSTFE